MSLPTPAVVNVPGMPANPNSVIGSIMYDWQENRYNLEWETRADFERWLTHEQQVLGIEIRQSKTCLSKAWKVYLTAETFCCMCNYYTFVLPLPAMCLSLFPSCHICTTRPLH